MMKEKERRIHPRLGVYHLVKYRVVSGDRPREERIIALRDISGGGVCLLTNEDLPVSTVLQLYIRFPGIDKPIPCLAKVSWKKYMKKSKQYRTGIQFIEIEEVLRTHVIKHIEAVRKKIEEENKRR